MEKLCALLVTAVVASLLVVGGGAFASPIGADLLSSESEATRRLAGVDRIATAVSVSQAAWPSGAAHVVLAAAGDYADALTGSALAGAKGGPVLLTRGDRLAPEVADEIERLDPDQVTVLGGLEAVSAGVMSRIEELGVAAVRLAGATRFETAAEVARELGDADLSSVYLVEGQHPDPGRGWPDAVAVSSLAARQHQPVLLTPGQELAGTTAGVLDELGISHVRIVGGRAAVSDAVVRSLRERGLEVSRVAGSTRYGTSVDVVADGADAGLDRAAMWLVTGRNWPDALAAGPAAAQAGQSLLLVDGVDLDRSPAAQRWLMSSAIREATLVGGSGVVSHGTGRDLAALIADQDRTGPRVAAAGDIACDPADRRHGSVSACRHVDTAALAENADAVFALGDLQYERATTANLNAVYDPSWGRFKDRTYPVVGNHEYSAGGGAADYFAYFDGRAGRPGHGYYEREIGGWQVLALDTNCHAHDGCRDGSAQQQWLEQRLAASTASCQLAMMHHPPFSSGAVHGSSPQLRGLLQTLREGGVDVVLAAHAHNYERLRRATPGGAADPDAGFRSFVVGTGGKDLRSFTPSAHPLTMTRTRRHFGVLNLELRPTSYRWDFRRLADSGHGGGPYTDTGFGSCR